MSDDARGEGEDDDEETSPDDETSSDTAASPDAVAKARREKRLGYATLGLIVGVVVLAFSPSWMIDRATKSDIACANRDYDELPGASEGCVWRARAWLALPKVLPWSHKEALGRAHAIERGVSERELKRWTRISPDAARRDLAALAFLERSKSPVVTLTREDGSTYDDDPRAALVAVLSEAGAWERAAEAGEVVRAANNLLWSYQSALAVGDVQRARAIARISPDRGDDPFELFLHTGAFLCLFPDDAEEGLARLRSAAKDYREHVGKDHPDAVVGEILCGDPTAKLEGTIGRSAVQAALLAREALPAIDQLPDVDKAAVGADALDVGDDRSPFVAAWIAGHSPSVAQAVDVVAPFAAPVSPLMGPFDLGARGTAGPFASPPLAITPARHEAAADKLVALASTAAPLDPPGPDASARFGDALRRAHADPAVALRAAAETLYTESALYHAAQHDRAPAEHDVEALLALRDAPDTELTSATILLSLDDVAGAKKLVSSVASNEAAPKPVREMALLEDALIAMHEGRWEDGLERAKRAHDLDVPELVVASSWMLTAAALRAGRPDEGAALPTPTLFERPKTTWEALASMPEDKRRDVRLRMQGLEQGPSAAAVLPAMFYVLGRASDDPETYVDAMSSIHDRSLFTPMGLRARAEAARWRGDEAAEKRWNDRANALAGMLRDPKSVALAELAGLL